MAELVLDRGHDVTFLMGSNMLLPDELVKLKMEVVKYQDPDIPVTEHPNYKQVLHDMAFKPSIFSQMKVFDVINTAHTYPPIRLFEDRNVMGWLGTQKFDMAIVDGVMPMYQFVPYKLAIPHALLMVNCMGHRRRIPVMPSYVPFMLTSYTDKMTFPQRVVNTLAMMAFEAVSFGGEEVSRKYFPELPVTSVNNLLMNASLCFQLRDNALDFVGPSMPDVIPVGSMMARPAQPLTADMQSFMDQSKHGVVLISFGSIVSDLPEDVLIKLMDGFRAIPYDVIMRHKGDIPGAPGNVRFLSWIPQNDLLADHHLRLFITHCGMNSLIEAAYHGVPVLGFPFGNDNHNNAAIVRAKGTGETMHLNDFTAEQLKDTIMKIISDDQYSKNAKKLSETYRDVKLNGPNDPVFWLEHVIKYGAKHLRAHAYYMGNIQYFMVDVFAFLIGTILVVFTLLFLLAKCMVKRMCRRNNKPKSKSE